MGVKSRPAKAPKDIVGEQRPEPRPERGKRGRRPAVRRSDRRGRVHADGRLERRCMRGCCGRW